MLGGVSQIFIHGSKQLSTRTRWASTTGQLSTRDTKQTKIEPNPQSSKHDGHVFGFCYGAASDHDSEDGILKQKRFARKQENRS